MHVIAGDGRGVGGSGVAHDIMKLRLDTFKRASKILTQIQEYSDIYKLNKTP